MNVWCCGKVVSADDWEFVGVFDCEEKAVAACKTVYYFVGKTTMNEELPSERVPWEGAYYPLQKGRK